MKFKPKQLNDYPNYQKKARVYCVFRAINDFNIFKCK